LFFLLLAAMVLVYLFSVEGVKHLFIDILREARPASGLEGCLAGLS
jgi:hypothetical protein